MDFLRQWKRWIRPLAFATYFILAIIALVLCTIELERKGAPVHVEAWYAGGFFVIAAIPISLWGILQHLINYTQPHLQRHIIRILWMVPIYALNAWFALRFPDAAIYLDTIRECYEAYVIYNFMAYLMNFLWTEHPQLGVVLRRKEQVRHLCPICWCPVWPMNEKFINRCKHGALQYTIVRPLTTVIALICQICDKYDEGNFNFTSAWSYLVIINNISQIWAMYCLVLFYKAMKEELKPIKPVPKFLCVKFVVFFSFWQSVLIAALVKLNLIPTGGAWVFYNNIEEIATGLQDFCICVEMLIAAIAHYFSFSHKDFIDSEVEPEGCCTSFLHMWDISDMREDVGEHFKVIGKTVKKTVSKPLLRNSSESTPLLSNNSYGSMQPAENNTCPTETEVTLHATSEQSIDFGDPANWDTSSVEVNNILGDKSFNPTDSMNNYAVFGSNSDKLNETDGGSFSQSEEESKSSSKIKVQNQAGLNEPPGNESSVLIAPANDDVDNEKESREVVEDDKDISASSVDNVDQNETLVSDQLENTSEDKTNSLTVNA